ncbi:hypothetical protein [Microbacterium sp. ZXX196]|uniref:hypothetical protein n=1 Tax=Microbacterium sp. ZXX196 TaxID=2609291 RepID=UPI0012B97A86|nr:hypothetical protein [Microbacterium sp. ZXX196]MTE23769.1 hypothetical protein [Microbacterium sp. ZXX196]
MSTSGEQGHRPLTRRELRELRAHGGEQAVAAATAAAQTGPAVVASTQTEEQASERRPLTRREIRRLRTNEVPVIPTTDTGSVVETPEKAAGPAGTEDAPVPTAAAEIVEEAPAAEAPQADDPAEELEVVTEVPSSPRPDEDPAGVTGEEPGTPTVAFDASAYFAETEAPAAPEAHEPPADTTVGDVVTEVPKLDPAFGEHIGRGPSAPAARSFDDLLDQYATTSPSSIIMTSSHRLPEGLGSTGAALGTTDGREVDAVLIDGELPAHSSPTPIAASAAISTQKSAGDVIRPPAPEKGRGLVFALGITAGVLGIVVVGSLATAYFMGVFN